MTVAFIVVASELMSYACQCVLETVCVFCVSCVSR